MSSKKRSSSPEKSMSEKLQELCDNLSGPKKRKATEIAEENAKKKIKVPSKRKKMFEMWVEALQRESAKSRIMNVCGPEYYKVTLKHPMSSSDYEDIFGMEKKFRLDRPYAIQELLGEVEIPDDGYDVEVWKKSRGRTFKTHDGKAELCFLEGKYLKTRNAVQLDFHMMLNYW